MKVYIASPFFDKDQLALVKEIESALTKANIDFYSPRSDGVLKKMSPEKRREKSAEIYRTNLRRINECSHVLAVIDNYDPGTMFEFGYAVAKGKAIHSLSNEGHKLNVMLAHAAYMHHNSVADAVGAFLGQTTQGVVPEVVT